MNRRSFLFSSASAFAIIPAIPVVVLPSTAHAAFAETALLGLSFANSVFGFMGSSRAAKAAALAQQARTKMLEGLVESMDEVIRSQALLLEKVDNLPQVFREILTDIEYQNQRLNVLSVHYELLQAKQAMIENVGGRAEDVEAVERYADRVQSELNEIRRVSTRLQLEERSELDTKNVLLRALCTRVEIDLGTELQALGRTDAFVPEGLEDHLDWFTKVVDVQTTTSVGSRANRARSELEQNERDFFTSFWIPDGEMRVLAATASVSYPLFGSDGKREISCWPDDGGGTLCAGDFTTSPVFQFHTVSRNPITRHYSALEIEAETEEYSFHRGGRYVDYAAAIEGRGYLDIPEASFEEARNNDFLAYTLKQRPNYEEEFLNEGITYSELAETVAVANMAIELCKRTLLLIRTA